DGYGRLLAYVELSGQVINRVMVERGHACVLHIPPNGEDEVDDYRDLEYAAEQLGRGLVAACDPIPCGDRSGLESTPCASKLALTGCSRSRRSWSLWSPAWPSGRPTRSSTRPSSTSTAKRSSTSCASPIRSPRTPSPPSSSSAGAASNSMTSAASSSTPC